MTKRKRILRCLLVLVISIFCFSQINISDGHAMTSEVVGDKVYRSGIFNFKIYDPVTGNSNINIRIYKKANATLPSFNGMKKNSTSWYVEIYSGTNNHNIKINDSNSIISTQKDINGEYFVLNVPLTYSLPAHLKYEPKTMSSTKPDGCRLNFKTYSAKDNGTNTASGNSTHSTDSHTVKLNIQVNTACTSIRTHEQRRYKGCTLSFGIYRPTAELRTKHWLSGFTKGDLNSSLANKNPQDANSSLRYLVLQHTDTAATLKCCSTAVLTDHRYHLSPPRGYEVDNIMHDNNQTVPLSNVNVGTNGNSISLYYKPISYSIGYNLDGGTNNSSNPSSYTINYPVTFYNPSRVGYQFLGWYNGSTKVGGINQGITNSNLTPSNVRTELSKREYGNKTITAKWNPNDYKVTFNPNGGSGSMEVQNFKYDTAQNLNKNVFKRYSYTFEGWNTKADGTGTTYSDQESVKNLTATHNGNVNLYAKWKPNEPPKITCPIVNNKDGNEIEPFINDNKLVIQKDDKFTAKYYATAHDYEDGDVTDSIRVLKNIPLENGRATKAGIFDVIYEARDSYDVVTTKTMTVQVNDPPDCITYDRFMFTKMNNVSLDKLYEQVMINDKEDGFVKPIKVELLAINDKSIEGEVSLNELLSEKGQHKITVKATDSLKGTGKNDFKLNVVDDIQEINKKIKTYPRFIDKNSIESLEPTSIWRIDSNYFNTLVNSLNNETPIKSYDLN